MLHRMPPENERTVLRATHDLMRRLGLATVFGNPGSTEQNFLEDWPSDFTYVLGLQEASVLGMANGWSRIMRRPALVSLHSGAGVGNPMGNLLNAWYDKAPLILLAEQQVRAMAALERCSQT
ncbi:thiamine pyrophosphate-binding protein [Methylobacterium sp. J-077]|uniref:thiamine pyrophosphate-binding protein n=1 Tax=Methylobacterium sp. J-077 TaxID=2836656 RepID=UPI001FBB659E|nr:thiamine pyrophosphate-binding protein [Methylobacterium sp. J-077]MCJ2124969.1 hypothetical protein [Methylobacterium sp. J-077]